MRRIASTTTAPIFSRPAASRAGGGGLLQHLLVPALERAVALAEVDDGAVAVGDDLQLDVARRLEIALHVDRAVAEGGLRLGLGGGDRLGQAVGVLGDLHAAPAAARCRLDQHWEADGFGGGHRLFDGRDPAVRAGDDRDAGVLHRLFGADLVAHDPDVLGARADEGVAVGFQDLGEAGVLREEAVAGGARLPRR